MASIFFIFFVFRFSTSCSHTFCKDFKAFVLILGSEAPNRKSVVFGFPEVPACQWLPVIGSDHVMGLPWLRGVGMWYGCSRQALWPMGSSITFGKETVREQGISL